jgi:hypothetical protein
VPENANVAAVSVVALGGPVEIEVSGGTESTIQLRLAGVGS